MKPWIKHSVGCGPSSCTPVLSMHDVVAHVPATPVAHRRVDRLEAAVEPDVVDAAVGHPLRDGIGGPRRNPRHLRRCRERQGRILAPGQVRVEAQVVAFGTRFGPAQRGAEPPSAASWHQQRGDARCAVRDRRRPMNRRSAAGAASGRPGGAVHRTLASSPATSGTGIGGSTGAASESRKLGTPAW